MVYLHRCPKCHCERESTKRSGEVCDVCGAKMNRVFGANLKPSTCHPTKGAK